VTLVVNTRPTGQGSRLSALLGAAGLEVLEQPLTRQRGDWDPAQLAETAQQVREGAYRWTVLTSANAARHADPAFQAVGADLSLLGSTRVIAGRSTARAAAACGLRVSDMLDRFSARTAAEHIVQQGGGATLVPCATESRPELTRTLEANGVPVKVLRVYRTEAVPPSELGSLTGLIAEGEVDVVVLTSPSGVKALLAGFEAAGLDLAVLATVKLAAIGRTTADAMAEVGLRAAAVASASSDEALVVAVLEALDPAGVAA
jgi:uroporphyrinogen-III synthase